MKLFASLKRTYCLLLIASLTACGGGGGSKSDSGTKIPSSPAAASSEATVGSSSVASSGGSSQSFTSTSQLATSSSPASTSGSSSSIPADTLLIGRIWHSFSDLDNPSGTFATDPNIGTTTSIHEEKWGTPWFDGSRLIHTDYNPEQGDRNTTRVVVRSTNDKTLLIDHFYEGYIGSAKPSPLGGNQVLAQWGETIFAPRAIIVWDLTTQNVLFATETSELTPAVDWMPDGSLLRVRASGAISRIVIGGDEQLLATVSWPESRVPQAVYVSPDGTKALVQLAALRDTGSVSSVDLWLMNVDGSDMKRYSDNGIISEALWSPDSNTIAFVKDTGISCTSFTCAGSCTVWYAPATATNVVAVTASNDAQQFPLVRPNGSITSLRCPIKAWTL